MNLNDNIINFIFGYIATHSHDDFIKIGDASFASWKTNKKEISAEIKQYFGQDVKSINFSDLILKIFHEKEPNNIPFANFFINYVKNNQNSDKPWISKDLKTYALNRLIDTPNNNNTDTQTSSNIEPSLPTPGQNSTDTTQNNVSQQIISTNSVTTVSSNNETSLNDFIKSIEDLKLSFDKQMENKLKSFMHNSFTFDDKNAHYIELEVLYDKYQRLDNSKSSTQSYITNKVFPKYFSNENFPGPKFVDDPEYITLYYQHIDKVRLEIFQFNLDYINAKHNDFQTKIKSKIETIKYFDSEIDEKVTKIKTRFINKFQKEHNQNMEKINKLIANKDQNKTSNSNQNNNNNSTIQKDKNYNNNTITSNYNQNHNNRYTPQNNSSQYRNNSQFNNNKYNNINSNNYQNYNNNRPTNNNQTNLSNNYNSMNHNSFQHLSSTNNTTPNLNNTNSHYNNTTTTINTQQSSLPHTSLQPPSLLPPLIQRPSYNNRDK